VNSDRQNRYHRSSYKFIPVGDQATTVLVRVYRNVAVGVKVDIYDLLVCLIDVKTLDKKLQKVNNVEK